MFGEVGALLARGIIPSDVLEGLRFGSVRGITVGDIIRRLVARTITKQIARQVEEASAPYQSWVRVCGARLPDIDGSQP